MNDDAAVQLSGLLIAIGGLACLFALPVIKLQRAAGEFSLFPSYLLLDQLGTLLGGLLLVWGIATLATGRRRSLTPESALAIPVVVAVPWIQAAFVPTPSDDAMVSWRSPATIPEVAEVVLVQNGGVFVGAAILAVVGVGIARGERTWIAVAGVLLFALAVLTGLLSHGFLYGFARPVIGAGVGAVIAAPFGYLVAAPSPDET